MQGGLPVACQRSRQDADINWARYWDSSPTDMSPTSGTNAQPIPHAIELLTECQVPRAGQVPLLALIKCDDNKEKSLSWRQQDPSYCCSGKLMPSRADGWAGARPLCLYAYVLCATRGLFCYPSIQMTYYITLWKHLRTLVNISIYFMLDIFYVHLAANLHSLPAIIIHVHKEWPAIIICQ